MMDIWDITSIVLLAIGVGLLLGLAIAKAFVLLIEHMLFGNRK